MAFTVRLTGDREIRAKLRRLESKLRRTIVVDAIRKAIEPLYERARAEAPVETGSLRDHIELEVKGDSRGRIIARIIVRRSEVKHSIPVELGAPSRHREPDQYLMRAFDAEGKKALKRAMDLIVKAIEREMRS